MATVSKTKDSGRGGGGGGGGGGGWREVGGGDYSGVLHQLLSAGWPCLSKKKEGRDGGKGRRRENHLTRHIEKKRALNAIKARGEISY